MKTKLVLWGTKGTEENTEKVLLALELQANENKTTCFIFSQEVATEELAESLMNQWRKGEAIAFPEQGMEKIEQELSASTPLIPEIYTTDKTELISRTQTEWLFIVLSTKLFKNYEGSLNELEEKVEILEKYSKKIWSELKEFWAKVQSQMKEQNLFKEHANLLRDRTNMLFAKMKELRAVEDAAFEKESTTNYEKIVADLEPIEAEIKGDGKEFHKAFELLKTIQRTFRNAKLTRELRTKLWERIDGAFKAIKEKRSPGSSSSDNRLARRIDGLKGAIKKMDDSIHRDQKELDFQQKKLDSVNATQLETQLREVRAKMIRERIESKSVKLDDMKKTLKDLEQKLERWEKRQKKEEAQKQEAKKEESKNEAPQEVAVEDSSITKEVEKAPEVPVENSTEETPKDDANASTEEVTAEVPKVEPTTETATEENSEKQDPPVA